MKKTSSYKLPMYDVMFACYEEDLHAAFERGWHYWRVGVLVNASEASILVMP